MFTFVIGGGPSGAVAQDTRPKVAVVNESTSSAAAELMAALRGSSAINASEQTSAQAQTAFEIKTWQARSPSRKTLARAAGRYQRKSQANALDALAAERAIANLANQNSRAQTAANFAAQEAERIRPFASQADRAAFMSRAATSANETLAQAHHAPERDPRGGGRRNL